MRKLIEIADKGVSGTGGPLIYHWINARPAVTALRNERLMQRR